MPRMLETVTVDGVELYHTYRGYDNDIEVYTKTIGNFTYSLYRRPEDREWRCDWSASYNCQPIQLEANSTDKEAMLKAFAAMLKRAPTATVGRSMHG